MPTTTETNITYCRRPVLRHRALRLLQEVYFLQNPTASGALGGAATLSRTCNRVGYPANNTVVVNSSTGNT